MATLFEILMSGEGRYPSLPLPQKNVLTSKFFYRRWMVILMTLSFGEVWPLGVI